MCRLFGFRSVVPSQVHRSLVMADNALSVQSNEHPDGWGVAYYVEEAPHIARSPHTALGDHLFHHLSGVVSSDTVLAHVRKATVGEPNVLNCHPFQYGRWTFAHNGEITEFDRFREPLSGRVAPALRRFILGQTDSEVVFFLFLTHLSKLGRLSARFSIEDVTAALRATVKTVREVCDGPNRHALLTLVATDGSTLGAIREGKELFYSTYKNRCGDRDRCPHLAPECEAPSISGYVKHFVVSSEPLRTENVWHPLKEGEAIGVDWRMRLTRRPSERRALATVS